MLIDIIKKESPAKFILFSFLVVLLAFSSYKILWEIHLDSMQQMAQIATDILDGYPIWQAFQNRLLGPFILDSIHQTLGVELTTSLNLYMLLITFASLYIIFFVLYTFKSINLQTALLFTALFSFGFSAIQTNYYYTWDQIDAIIFALLCFGAYHNFKNWFFILLFIVALANRESALFVALYIILRSFEFNSLFSFRIKSLSTLVTGVILLVLGIFYVIFIRQYLFISQPDYFQAEISSQFAGTHLPFLDNMRELFIDNLTSVNINNTIFLTGSLLFFVFQLPKLDDKLLKLSLLYIAITVSFFIFAKANEARLYTPLLILLINILVMKKETGQLNRS